MSNWKHLNLRVYPSSFRLTSIQNPAPTEEAMATAKLIQYPIGASATFTRYPFATKLTNGKRNATHAQSHSVHAAIVARVLKILGIVLPPPNN